MGLDLHNNISHEVCLAPQVVTTSKDGTGIDKKGAEGIQFEINVGAEGDTLSGSLYHDFILEDSDDNATFAAVTGEREYIGEMETPASGIVKRTDLPADAPALYSIGYVGTKRYARVRTALTGTHTNGTPISITAHRYGGRYVGKTQFESESFAI